MAVADNVNQPVIGKVTGPDAGVGAKRLMGPWVEQPGRLARQREILSKGGLKVRGHLTKALPRLRSRKMV